MIIDTKLQFAKDVTLAASGNSDILDLGKSGYIGDGEDMVIAIAIESAANATTTFKADLKFDDTATPATVVGSSTTKTLTITTATTNPNDLIFIPVPAGLKGQYLMLTLTLAGTVGSVKYSAFLTTGDMVQNTRQYAAGYTVNP